MYCDSLYDAGVPVSKYNMLALRLSNAAAVCSTGSRILPLFVLSALKQCQGVWMLTGQAGVSIGS